MEGPVNVLYETACEHLALRNPRNVNFTEEFVCRSCKAVTRIIGVQLMEYKAWCSQCNWTRYTGMSAQIANREASRHMLSSHHFDVKAGWAVNPSAKKERERIAKGNLI
jgi:predicted nucleic-acid-binding Zn-ribbon protein